MNLSSIIQLIPGIKVNDVPRIGITKYENSILTCDLSDSQFSGDIFYHTVTENTTIDFNFSSMNKFFLLILKNAGNYTITWPSYLMWTGKTTPPFTIDGIDYIYVSKINIENGNDQFTVSASMLKDMGTQAL